MKKVFNSFFVIIAAMVTFAGCAKQEIDAPATPETKTVQFFANSIETKTVFGTPEGTSYPTLWNVGDKVKVLLNIEQVSGTEKIAEVECEADLAESARFEVAFAPNTAPESYTYYAVCPSSAYNAKSSADGRITVIIPTDQTPLETTVDKDAQIIYAVAPADADQTSVDMDFHHLTAYGKLTLKNLPEDISVSEVKIVAPDGLYISGKWNYLVADGSIAAHKEATMNALTIKTTRTTDIWFACGPVDVSNKTLTLTVTTNEGDFVKELNFPANRKFEAGKIAKFTVDMTGITAGGTDEPEQPGENEGTSVATLSSEEIKTKIAASKCAYGTPVSYEDMDDGVVWTSTCYTDASARPWLQMKADEKVYIKISSDSDIKEVEITVTGASNSSGGISDITKHTSFSGTLSLNTQADGKGTNVSSGSAANNIVTLTPTGNYKTLYLKTSTGARVWNIDVKKSDGGNEGGNETPDPTPDPDPEPETPVDPVKLTMSDITCSAQTENSLTFTWTAVANANGYEVSCNGKTETVSNSTLTYTVTGLAATTEYTISIKACGDGTNYSNSEPKTQIGTTTAVQGGDSTGGYTLITDISEITSGTYVIAAKVNNNYYAMSKTFASKINGTQISVTNNTIAESAATNYVVTITKSGDSYTIKSGSNYLKYNSSTNLGTQTSEYNWKIAQGTKGTFRFTSANSGRGLVFRAGTYNQFGGYALSNITANGTEYYDVELFKLN